MQPIKDSKMTDSNALSSWFNTYNRSQQGQSRIFAFPYSGAGSSIFYQWAQSFHHSPVDFIGVQLPGRENRLRDKPISDLVSLIEQLQFNITPWLDKPFVFFGHSLGALIAFELCRALHEQNLPLPQHLFISAFRAPELPNPNRELHQLPATDIISGLREYAGTPEVVLNDPKLMALFLPLLRADFSVHETYQYQEKEQLPHPITVLSGTRDTIVRPETMYNWHRQTVNNFQHLHYDGDHFFLNPHRDDIIRHLQQVFL